MYLYTRCMRKNEECDVQKWIISHFIEVYGCENDCILVHRRASQNWYIVHFYKKSNTLLELPSRKISLDAKLSKQEIFVKFA